MLLEDPWRHVVSLALLALVGVGRVLYRSCCLVALSLRRMSVLRIVSQDFELLMWTLEEKHTVGDIYSQDLRLKKGLSSRLRLVGDSPLGPLYPDPGL